MAIPSFFSSIIKKDANTIKKILITVILLCIFFAFILFRQLDNKNGNIYANEADVSYRIHDCGISKQNSWKFGKDEDKYAESKRIKQSFTNELIEISARRDEAHITFSELNQEIPKLQEIVHEQELLIQEQKLKLKEYNDLRNVHLKLPKKPLSLAKIRKEPYIENIEFQTLEESIDYRRCSISKKLSFFLYPLASEEKDLVAINIYNALKQHPGQTGDATFACLFVAIITTTFNNTNYKYWNGYGRNHMLIFVNQDHTSTNDIGAAIAVKSFYSPRQFRPNFDIATFLRVRNSDISDWETLSPLLPHDRKILFTYQTGSFELTDSEIKDLIALQMSANHSQDLSFIELNCLKPLNKERMSLCDSKKDRKEHLLQSVFTLIYPNTLSFHQRFYEALEAGTIPIILSTTDPLPFEDLIDWRKAAFRIPISRLPELHFILRSVSLSDILEYRRKGRFFLENYLLNTQALVKTLYSVMRYRLQMAASDDKIIQAKPLFHSNNIGETSSFFSPNSTTNFTRSINDDEKVGPLEAPFPSNKFAHNFTAFGMYAHTIWNNYPFFVDHSPEFFLEDVPMPSEAEFFNDTSSGMRPISPGSGVTFSEALGSNRPREQFTIVIVTYNRDQVLKARLQDLQEIPFLNRIIVIWNNIGREPPSTWPRLNIPIYFIKAEKNSLNNRFIPYDLIETEAVLSLDDDIDLKRPEIVFAFRVWRQDRTKLVGFPARHHARFGDSMFYNSNHTCQHSMILTGAAFLHKNYFYAYTYGLPKIIHQKVDELMNCEDIAMNFLVAHLTRQPPIKTTSKWTIRCPNCVENLSNDAEHFEERHKCIRFFTQVFGYNPLLFSQYRVDSVLFKTRVPPNHQKCYRLI